MALTWRNVDGPDFGRSLEGIRTFSSLFGDAVGGLNQGLSQFDAAQDKKANNVFAMDLLKYQDPAAYKAALASGQVFANIDPRRLNQANIQAAGARSTDLLNQRIGEFGLERDQYGFDRRKTTDTNQDAAAPLIAGAISAGRSGQDAFTKYMASNPALAKLGLADATALATGALDAESKGVGIDTGRQAYTQSGTRFGWETTDRATADEADKVLANITRNSFDGDSAMTALNGMKDVSPKVYNAVMGRIGGMFPGGGGAGGSPAGDMISGALGGGGGGDPTRIITGGGKGNLGIGYVPDSVQNLGQAVEFGKSLNRRGQESSAMGVYQIVQSTMESVAPTVLGADWKSKPFNFASQDAVARKIFENTGGDPTKLRQQWTSLDPATAQRIARMPWEQARQVIAAGESKADPRALALGLTATEQGVRNANMERNANNPANTYAKSAGDGRSVGEVAAALTSDPVFKGMDVGYLNEQLRLVQNYARRSGKTINAAVASDIIRNSVTSSWASRNLPSWMGGGDKQGVYIDGSAAKRYVDEYKQGNVDNAVLANANTAQAQGVQTQAKGVYDQALARYQSAQRAQARGANIDLRPLEGAVNRAAAMLSATTSSIGNNRAMVSFNHPAAPAPVAVTRTGGAQPTRARVTSPVAAPSNAMTAQRQALWQRALARGG